MKGTIVAIYICVYMYISLFVCGGFKYCTSKLVSQNRKHLKFTIISEQKVHFLCFSLVISLLLLIFSSKIFCIVLLFYNIIYINFIKFYLLFCNIVFCFLQSYLLDFWTQELIKNILDEYDYIYRRISFQNKTRTSLIFNSFQF